MESIEKLWAKLQNQQKLKGEIQRAAELFSFKPFVEEYLPLKKLAGISRPFLGLFSVVTGLGFLVEAFEELLPFYLGLVLGLLLLLLVEFSKNLLASISFRKLYGNSRHLEGWILLVFLGGLIGVSVYCSVLGAARLYERLDSSEDVLNQTYQNEKDSINAYYNRLIMSEKMALSEYKKSVSWQGKINVYNQTNQAVIQRHNEQIRSLEKQQLNELEKRSKLYEQERVKLAGNREVNTLFWLVLSAGVEGSILLCLWFSIYYPYRVHQDKEVLASVTGKMGVESEHISGLGEVLQLYLPTVELNGWAASRWAASRWAASRNRNSVEAKQPIGFERSKPTDTVSVAKETAGVTNVTPTVTKESSGNGYRSGGYRIRCRYCGTAAVMKSPQAIYCCDEHRIADHRRISYHSGKEWSLRIPFQED